MYRYNGHLTDIKKLHTFIFFIEKIEIGRQLKNANK